MRLPRESFLVKSTATRKSRDEERLPPAVVLAGGLGTRLRAAYSAGPKSMAPVGERPFLDYLLRWLRSQGIEQVVLCVGYRRSQIQRYVGVGRKWGLRVRYSVEDELLGTGGAVKKAEKLISGNWMVVVNGDTFLDVNLEELTRIHRNNSALATVAVVKVTDNQRYGSVKLDGEGRIVKFVEKRQGARKNETRKTAINGGVYVFEKRLLNRVRPGRRISLEKEVFPPLLRSKRVFGVVKEAYFLDIGIPDDLGKAQSELPKRFSIGDTR